VPLTPAALRFNTVPTQSGFGVALTLVIVGTALTVTKDVTDVLLVHPVVVEVTVKLYTPEAAVAVAVNDGATPVDVKPLGPVQL